MSTHLNDANQRARALDPRGSFIVQAPAGSGKTELLTQRFLLLLGIVKQPEEILAMTFTRKAAAEMRARIINALKQARDFPKPELSHAQTTWDLARRVLAQDDKYHWQLLANPNRLRIQTIDAFNNSLTRQLPILSQFGASPELTDEADTLYHAAVCEMLSHLEEDLAWSDAIATLLIHRDNDLEKVTSLLKSLLARRDQWLPDLIRNANNPHLRQHCEQQLKEINLDVLNKLHHSFPKDLSEEFITLARFAAEQLSLMQSSSPITRCATLTTLPGTQLADKTIWLAIAELVLTMSDSWRKRFDKNTGFPADKTHAEMKQRMLAWMDDISRYDNFFHALIELRQAPEPTYSDQQWELLSALHKILRITVAQLKMTFSEQGKMDYTENALAALNALGTEDAPTDLTLALDHQIKHLLVDEFQDTSNSQFRLLEKLITGWEKNDGRTLFLVGDPMQSIYLFREAEVGLFIRAKQQGIGHLKLESLVLAVNFRSTLPIIDWVNAHFPTIFPTEDQIANAAISYSPSYAANQTATTNSAVTLISEQPEKNAWQGQRIVEIIREYREKNPEEIIAILVRSRTHLNDIIPALRQAGLSYRAIDIDPLSERPVIQDLLALTRAILDPADRIAWLAILRAPWCGLLLADLLKIAAKNARAPLWQPLQSDSVVSTLSLDAKKRVQRVMPILSHALSLRDRAPLADLVENTWHLLGGPACVAAYNDLQDSKTYFHFLRKKLLSTQRINADLLEQWMTTLYAAPHTDADERLQIMTIHNSKGLEFDTVILPHLEKQTTRNDRELLAWMERTTLDKESAFMMAPIQASDAEPDSVYEYIRKQNECRSEHEKSRLLYVAVTRAKKNLIVLFDQPSEGKVANGSLLSKLWPAINHSAVFQTPIHNEEINISSETEKHPLQRLSIEWKNPVTAVYNNQEAAFHQSNTGFMLPDMTARHLGTLTHQIIQQLCQQGTDWWTQQADTIKHQWLENSFIHLGISSLQRKEMIKKIFIAIQNILNDKIGRWIISPHQCAQSEYRLSTFIDQQPMQCIVDRTFIDEKGVRWIIDFKTSIATESLEKFIPYERKKYEKQLQQYAMAFRALEERPIHCGLYFPMVPAWETWVAV
ncbi:MAG: UvrD-helicase domain-containing protein [Gammaproteobacteria bacterium]|nr:UvrD-helicase domain-containing protein [Gammaproteobacteria bacterium]